MENKLPTAEQLLTDNYTTSVYDDNCQLDCSGYLKQDVIKAMIEFAKLHVQKALLKISKDIPYKELSVDWKIFDKNGVLLLDNDGVKTFKKCILKAYNLNEIV